MGVAQGNGGRRRERGSEHGFHYARDRMYVYAVIEFH